MRRDQADGADTALDAAVAYGRAIDVLRAIGNEAALGKALFAFGRYKAETGALADGKDMLRDAIAVFCEARAGAASRRCRKAARDAALDSGRPCPETVR